MTYTTTQFRLGPEFTPKGLKNLIFLTVGASISCILLDIFMQFLFGFSGIQNLLSLSWHSLNSLFIWQPFTYIFAPHSGYTQITINYLLSLAYLMYALWIMGADLIDRVDTRPFIRFYIISGALAGLLTLFMMELTGYYPFLSGPIPPILATLTAWTMLGPNKEILLFFLIPVKVKWIATGIFAAIFLTTLSQFDLVSMTFYLSGLFVGYAYAAMVWQLPGPFPFTRPVDRFLANLSSKFNKRKTFKIIDFQTGKEEIENDAAFVDAMLEKISKKGEGSLTIHERARMKKISEKMKR